MISPFEDRISPEPNSGCWLWAGSVRRDYRKDCYSLPRIKIKKKYVTAYRAVYEIVKGPIPAGLMVCHRCDTPMCVNPDHLWLGTQADNVADMMAKGRKVVSSRVGALNSNAKLTTAQAQSVKDDKRSHREIASSFEISLTAVSSIKKGRSWKGLLK